MFPVVAHQSLMPPTLFCPLWNANLPERNWFSWGEKSFLRACFSQVRVLEQRLCRRNLGKPVAAWCRLPLTPPGSREVPGRKGFIISLT